MSIRTPQKQVIKDFLANITKTYKTILADPPWRFKSRKSALSPENNKRFHYPTLSLSTIQSLPIDKVARKNSHLYLWIPVSMLQDGLTVLKKWGFSYKTSITWEKIRNDGLPDGSGYGHYFRNATEVILFGVKGSLNTHQRSHSFSNIIRSKKREHSRKPDEQYQLIESCSPGPYLELFARSKRKGWTVFGNQTGKFK